MARRNEKSAAVAVERPESWPPTMVDIDRDAPGHSAKHWKKPMTRARFGVTLSSPSSPRSPRRRRIASTTIITTPPATSAPAMGIGAMSVS